MNGLPRSEITALMGMVLRQPRCFLQSKHNIQVRLQAILG